MNSKTKPQPALRVHDIVTTLWFLMAACNHHENGQFARKSDQFRFNRGDHFIDVHGPEIVFDWYKNAGNKQRVRVSTFQKIFDKMTEIGIAIVDDMSIIRESGKHNASRHNTHRE